MDSRCGGRDHGPRGSRERRSRWECSQLADCSRRRCGRVLGRSPAAVVCRVTLRSVSALCSAKGCAWPAWRNLNRFRGRHAASGHCRSTTVMNDDDNRPSRVLPARWSWEQRAKRLHETWGAWRGVADATINGSTVRSSAPVVKHDHSGLRLFRTSRAVRNMRKRVSCRDRVLAFALRQATHPIRGKDRSPPL